MQIGEPRNLVWSDSHSMNSVLERITASTFTKKEKRHDYLD